MIRSKTVKSETAYLCSICKLEANRRVLTRVIPQSQQTNLFPKGTQPDSQTAVGAYPAGTARRELVTTKRWNGTASLPATLKVQTISLKTMCYSAVVSVYPPRCSFPQFKKNHPKYLMKELYWEKYKIFSLNPIRKAEAGPKEPKHNQLLY